jgi:hypothetical protein
MQRMGLAKLSTVALKKELQRRLEALPKLIAQRDELNRQIAELEAPSAAATAPTLRKAPASKKVARKAKRAKNPVPLPEALVQAISGKKGVSISEAVAGVLATGYTSTSKDFPNIVKKTLANDKRFQRVARGVYRVKS